MLVATGGATKTPALACKSLQPLGVDPDAAWNLTLVGVTPKHQNGGQGVRHQTCPRRWSLAWGTTSLTYCPFTGGYTRSTNNTLKNVCPFPECAPPYKVFPVCQLWALIML